MGQKKINQETIFLTAARVVDCNITVLLIKFEKGAKYWQRGVFLAAAVLALHDNDITNALIKNTGGPSNLPKQACIV